MAELHIIGQIIKAIDFDIPKLYCKWSLQAGNSWKLIEGESEGQTVVSFDRCLENSSTFAHSIDAHFATHGVQGWPKLHIEIFAVNALNKTWPIGYGFVHLPTQPGHHVIEINTWEISTNTFIEKLQNKFWFNGFTLTKSDLIFSGLERYKLQTKSSGKIIIEISLLFRNFNKFGIEFK